MAITDLTPFRQYVDAFDITEEQKLELVNTVYGVAKTIAAKAFGKLPVQQSLELQAAGALQNRKPPLLSLVEPNGSGASKLRR